MLKKYFLIFYSFGKQLQKDNIGAHAASISFFFLLSVFPVLVILFTILAISPISEEVVLKILVEITPGFLDEYIYLIFGQAEEMYGTVLPIAVVVLLWSAGKGMWGLMMGLNTANGVTEKRNALWVRLLSSLYSLIMIIVLVVCMCVIVAGERFVEYIENLFPRLSMFLGLMGNLRFLVVWGFLILLFMMIYAFIPNIKNVVALQAPGAVFAATGWSVVSWGFSLYMEYFGTMTVYGSLSTLILVMIWIYTCMYIMLLGANINGYFKPLFEKSNNKAKFNR